MTEIAWPLRIDGRGKTATASEDEHVRQLIEQVLFTAPGERVNRPDFGCGLLALVFAPNSDELATATQFLVQGSLQRWLGDRIALQDVEAAHDEGTLRVTVVYTLRSEGQRRVATFERPA